MSQQKQGYPYKICYDNPGFTSIYVSPHAQVPKYYQYPGYLNNQGFAEKARKESSKHHGEKKPERKHNQPESKFRTDDNNDSSSEDSMSKSCGSRRTCLVVIAVVVALLIGGGIAAGVYFGITESEDKDGSSETKSGMSDTTSIPDTNNDMTTQSILEKDNPLGTRPTEEFRFHEQMDLKYFLYWDFSDDAIIFEAHVITNGYIGFGISNSAKMYPADIALFWMKDGQGVLKDYHSTAKEMPELDTKQDWSLISATKTGQVTIVKFSRKLDTCDTDHDRIITEGTTRVIFSYGDMDQTKPDTAMYHGINRGSRSLFLLDPPGYERNYVHEETEGQSSFFITTKDFKVPQDKDTTYLCSVHKAPEFDSKKHVIMFDRLVQPGNEAYVHHMILYYCVHPLDVDALDGFEYLCYYETPPNLQNCFNFFIGWAVGGREFYLPEEAGFSLGTEHDPKLFILEIHYDNPNLKPGIVDSSGFKITVTSKLRKYDAATLTFGTDTNPNMIIPPYEEDFIMKAHCAPDCLIDSLRNETMYVFGGIFHSHLLGDIMKARVSRGAQEKTPLLTDSGYDFNFQELRTITPPYEITAGDRLSLECWYKSKDRTQVSFGGLSTTNEMCLVFLFYYPRTPMTFCLSEYQYPVPPGFNAYYEYAATMVDWTNETTRAEFKKLTDDVLIVNKCGGTRFIDGHGRLKSQREMEPSIPVEPKKSTCT